MIKRVVTRPVHRLAASGLAGGLFIGVVTGLLAMRVDKAARVTDTTAGAAPGQPFQSLNRTTPAVEATDEYTRPDRLRRFQARPSRPATTEYEIQPGDSLWLIANRFGSDTGTIQALNPDASSQNLRPGQTLTIVKDFAGVARRSQTGDTLDQLALTYGVPVDQILQVNDLSTESTLEPGTVLFLPGARARAVVASRGDNPRRATQDVSSAQPDPPANRVGWVWPVSGGRFFSEFGPREDGFHPGLDIAVTTGTPAVAVRAGTVTFAGWDGGYGYSVILDHGKGLKTRYAHASSLLVHVGQAVAQGDPVIFVGSTGNSTGPHLHLEVLVNSSPRNPRAYLP